MLPRLLKAAVFPDYCLLSTSLVHAAHLGTGFAPLRSRGKPCTNPCGLVHATHAAHAGIGGGCGLSDKPTP